MEKKLKPSEFYDRALTETRKFHARSKTFSGKFLWHYAEWVNQLCASFGCRSMLDYGCGKGMQWREPYGEWKSLKEYFGVDRVALFDPGVPRFERRPEGQFDIVICTQVLGSIPVVDLPWALQQLDAYAAKCVFIGERIGPCKKKIHAEIGTEMPHGWSRDQWAEVIAAEKRSVPFFLGTLEESDRFGEVFINAV